jgi:hypothetical protein
MINIWIDVEMKFKSKEYIINIYCNTQILIKNKFHIIFHMSSDYLCAFGKGVRCGLFYHRFTQVAFAKF